MKSAMSSKQNKLRKQNHRRKLSSNPGENNNNDNNNDNYYDQNGVETGPDQEDNDVNDIGNEDDIESNMKSSKCAVSSLILSFIPLREKKIPT